LSNDVVASIRPKIAGFSDLVPFSRISDVPLDAKWTRVSDISSKDSTKNIEAYDLTWGEKAYDGSIVLKKWRVFADPKTNRPHKIEGYQTLNTRGEYTLVTMIVEYLSASDIQKVIKGESF